MFKEVADIKTSDQLHLPVPEAKFETVVVQPSEVAVLVDFEPYYEIKDQIYGQLWNDYQVEIGRAHV